MDILIKYSPTSKYSSCSTQDTSVINIFTELLSVLPKTFTAPYRKWNLNNLMAYSGEMTKYN